LAVAHALHERRLILLQYLVGYREGAGKNLPPSGFCKYFLCKQKGRFSRFLVGAAPVRKVEIKRNQVNALSGLAYGVWPDDEGSQF
jgi:hypothetical protein